MVMAGDWPDEPLPSLFAAMVQGGEFTAYQDFTRGRVGIHVGDHHERITPAEARRLACDYEARMKRDDKWDLMHAKRAVKLLRSYADDVEPYYDDAEE